MTPEEAEALAKWVEGKRLVSEVIGPDLTVLGEECAETAQRASKAARFGLQEIQPGQSETNARRLEREMSEAVAILEEMGLKIREEDKIAKIEKLKKYMEYSRSLGLLKD